MRCLYMSEEMEATRQQQKPRRQSSFMISDILTATPSAPTLFQQQHQQKEMLDVTAECFRINDTTATESLSQDSTGEGGMHELNTRVFTFFCIIILMGSVMVHILSVHVPSCLSVGSGKSRKRKPKTVFSYAQVYELEQRYAIHNHLTPNESEHLGGMLNLTSTQVKIWFSKQKIQEQETEPRANIPALPSHPYALVHVAKC